MYGILSTVHQRNSRFGTIFLTIIVDLKKTLQALQVFAKKLFLVCPYLYSVLFVYNEHNYIIPFCGKCSECVFQGFCL